MHDDDALDSEVLFARYGALKVTALKILDDMYIRNGRSADSAIYERLQNCLDIIEAQAVFIKFDACAHLFSCYSLDFSGNKESFEAGLLTEMAGRSAGINSVFAVQVEGRWLTCYAAECGDQKDIVAFLSGDDMVLRNGKLPSENIHPFATTMREVLRKRNSSYRHFPADLANRYWGSISNRDLKEKFVPPWGKAVPTITLSLDLRKSTFAMDQAENNRLFAVWMRKLVEELAKISRGHLAVFDKFTGDGVIVHFLVDDVERLHACKAIECALRCAGAMVGMVEDRLQDLRQFIHNDSALLGAGVGVAIGDAYWDLDDAGNPIVVGRGVVGACRAGDSALAGDIRLTNLAYQKFRQTPLGARARAVKVPFASKDLSDKLEVLVWKVRARDIRLPYPEGC